MMDLLSKDRLKNRLSKHPNIDQNTLSEMVETYSAYGDRLRAFVTDTSLEINKAIVSGKRIIMEGAQGTMLDVDHGTYPFVTSSNQFRVLPALVLESVHIKLIKSSVLPKPIQHELVRDHSQQRNLVRLMIIYVQKAVSLVQQHHDHAVVDGWILLFFVTRYVLTELLKSALRS